MDQSLKYKKILKSLQFTYYKIFSNFFSCPRLLQKPLTLSIEEYLNKVRQYLKDTINNLKKCGT